MEDAAERRSGGGGETGKKSVLMIPSYQRAATDVEGGGGTPALPRQSLSPALRPSLRPSLSSRARSFTPPPPPPPCPSQTPENALGHRQKGNPLLKHIRNVKWVFADVVCDYLLGQNSCALYISLRYHLLHPDYLYYRIRELQKNFKLRVVLCHVDVVDVAKPLLEVTRTSLLHDCTLLCGWSLEECGRYLETIKVYEKKSADSIREQMDTDYLSRLTHALTTIRHVNKTDVITLGTTFGSLSGIMDSSMEDLARCPGLVKRLYDTFHKPFRRVSSESTVPLGASAMESAPREPPLVAKNDELAVEGTADSSKDGKEPDFTVKSALSTAFAKYSSKIRSRDRKNHSVEGGSDGTSGE
ncbi:unnamed protein product [Spirodela intermedia]|uniref:DNA excision repair protein ERCC-1 n=1 Tax=Spirodela intermedia TaxID=51605 RepID=A0A7I8J9R1_SPIIN|nr:unnamed protein product [Spirodela intermedia]CAA6666887.1 unnamed protein product [Spirodela intermedia]